MAVETSSEDDRQSENGMSSMNAPGSEEQGNIEQYGVWVKAGPVDIGDDEEDPSQFSMEDLEPESEGSALTQEEEDLLGTLESEELSTTEGEEEDFRFDDLPELEDSDFDNEETSTEALLNMDQEDGDSLDDISDFAFDLPDSHEEEGPMAIPEESASILQKIEKDLLSIKDEITALKNEINSLRGGPRVEPEEFREESESGFFEEDEDETIALTGDELDNILNTADITEQTGQSTASPEDNDLLLEDEESEEAIIDRDDILFDEVEETPVADTTMSLGDEADELSIDESLADLAAITEAPTEELVLDEAPETTTEGEDILDLPEEEEIVLDDIGEGVQEISLEEPTEEAEEIELDLGEPAEAEETSFELDEELQLSPSEEEDLEASQDIVGEEEFADIGDLDDAELAEMESEAAGGGLDELAVEDVLAEEPLVEEAVFDEAVEEEPLVDESVFEEAALEPAEQEPSIDEAFDLSDEELEPPTEEMLSEPEEPVSLDMLQESGEGVPEDLKSEIRTILKYMDQLLESLPENKIEEFANSEYFDVYKKLFEELGLAT